jgi:hypothetical protein
MRKKILSKTNRDDYVNELEKEIGSEVEIEGYEAKELLNLDVPLIEIYKVKVKAFENTDQLPLLFNPFIVGKQESNPFKARERLYPVDFGVPQEETFILNLEYPDGLKISELPAGVGLSLPNGGGRYIQNIQNSGKKLSMSSSLVIAKTIYSSAEYHFLKELYTRMIAAQNVDLVFEKDNP